MKGKYYTTERSVQLLISLLKQHGIKKVITSPGATNISFVASMMQDPWFEMYSSVDERSAAYIACGLSAESGEPVVLTCTGATASRNYIPGLTEAYYRKLPVLAVTSTQDINKIGHLMAQVIDRRSIQNDIALLSEHIPVTCTDNDIWSNTVRINRALLELKHRGGGPVHINLTTTYSRDYSVRELPVARMICRTVMGESFPEFSLGRVAVFVGNHRKFTESETEILDAFCAAYDGVVFCDQTSGYHGKYRVQFALVLMQENAVSDLANIDLLIHIGEVSGDYAYFRLRPRQVWRVSEDGELRDMFHKLTHVFEMPERLFFIHYVKMKTGKQPCISYLDQCRKVLSDVRTKVQTLELPFSNTWIASQTAHRLPEDSVLHLGILNTLRNWNLFDTPASVLGYSNTGGFGIDGDVSSFIGASLAHPDLLYFAVVGDLAFFYDLNVLGNRHVARNVRILLVNNGKGTEFRNYNHLGAIFEDEADRFIAAGGHYGNKSRVLVRHYAEDLGYEYLTAETKEEYVTVVERFLTPELAEHPMLLEVFTDNENESNSLKAVCSIENNTLGVVRTIAKSILSEKNKLIVKKYWGKI